MGKQVWSSLEDSIGQKIPKLKIKVGIKVLTTWPLRLGVGMVPWGLMRKSGGPQEGVEPVEQWTRPSRAEA